MMKAVFAFALILAAAKADLVRAGKSYLLWNSTSPEDEAEFYLNDHTFFVGPGGDFHVIGISHTEAADPLFEVNLAHATTATLSRAGAWRKMPFAMGNSGPESHLWAPHVTRLENGTLVAVYCGGSYVDRRAYHIRMATSVDGFSWRRIGTLFSAGVDGRDPMVMRLPDDGGWVMYYTGTVPNEVRDDVEHVTFFRTSKDLLHWSPEGVAFVGGSDGSCAGGPTESPFVVGRGGNFYLFTGSWAPSYDDTRVFVSTDPFDFGSVPSGTAKRVGTITSHAPEVVRDFDGRWWVSSAGWGRGGLTIAPLEWLDGLDDKPTSMPTPTRPPSIPADFHTNLQPPWVVYGASSQWLETPSGLEAGMPLSDAFRMSSRAVKESSAFSIMAQITLVTKDGNPTSSRGRWTRTGTAAAIVVRCHDRTAPLARSLVVNVHTDEGGRRNTSGSVKAFRFPYEEIGHSDSQLVMNDVPLAIRVDFSGESAAVFLGTVASGKLEKVLSFKDPSFDPSEVGFIGLNVWQGSALFQNVMVDESPSMM